MKAGYLLAPLALLLVAGPARAIDHNNLDAGRPLRFDDAEAIAFREHALEFGLGGRWPRGRPLGLGLNAEYLYGFALNTHLDFNFARPSIGGRPGVADNRFDYGDVAVGVLHNFNREYGSVPAFSLRGDVFFPSGRTSKGVATRLRGIMSRHVDQYGRMHLNLDLNANPGAARRERQFHPGATAGYSRPLGYPTQFATTGLAEVSVQAGRDRGTGPVVSAGIGLRKQIGVRSVVDVGVQSDLIGFSGGPRDRIRLVGGYSYGF